jgi:phosphoglycolate phosphatase-like HAD superfamily hydrolase
MTETILLDLDGPVLDGKHRHYACYRDILVENGFVPISLEAYWEMKRNRLDRRAQLGASNAEGIYDRFLASWMERIEERGYLSLDRLQPGATERMEEWRRQGIRLILVTLRNNEPNLLWQLDLMGIRSLLDEVVCVGSSGGAEGKAAAARSAVGTGETESLLWIGDTEIDIAAARRLGVAVCAVGCGLRAPSLLAQLKPDFLVHGLSEFDILP